MVPLAGGITMYDMDVSRRVPRPQAETNRTIQVNSVDANRASSGDATGAG